MGPGGGRTYTGGASRGIFKLKWAFHVRKDNGKNNKNHTDTRFLQQLLVWPVRGEGSGLSPGCFLIVTPTSLSC